MWPATTLELPQRGPIDLSTSVCVAIWPSAALTLLPPLGLLNQSVCSSKGQVAGPMLSLSPTSYWGISKGFPPFTVKQDRVSGGRGKEFFYVHFLFYLNQHRIDRGGSQRLFGLVCDQGGGLFPQSGSPLALGIWDRLRQHQPKLANSPRVCWHPLTLSQAP